MRILIIKTSSLGDIVHTFPTLEYLKHYFPDVCIDWVVEKPFSDLVANHPFVNKVLTIQTKKWRKQGFFNHEVRQEIKDFYKTLRQTEYDYVFDLQGNIKSGLVTAFSRSSQKIGFAYSSVPEKPNILFTNYRFNPPRGKNIREDYLYLVKSVINKLNFNSIKSGVHLKLTSEENKQIKNILKDNNNQFKIMVCCGSNWTNKQLPISTMQSFLDHIQKEFNAFFYFIWGATEEKELVEQLAKHFSDNSLIVDKLKLNVLQNLMSNMDLVISMDSLPLHLAGTTSTSTYSIFGPSLSTKYMPVGFYHAAYQGKCPYNKTFEKRCSILRTCETGACTKEIKAEELFKHFMEWRNALNQA